MKIYKLMVPLLAVMVSGCSSISGLMEAGKTDYKSASNKPNLPPLEIPPNLTRPTGDDRFTLPASASATYSSFAAGQNAPRAPGSTDVLPNVDKVRMERAGSQRWLVVPESPEKIWPAVKEFWLESGFLVNLEIPEAGVMETDWAENRAKIPTDFIRNTLGRFLDQVYSTGERDKFRTRLERGAEPNTTEIYISHRGVSEVVSATRTGGDPASFVWQARPADPELEAEFLRKLMVRFGVQDGRAKDVIATAPKIERAKLLKAAEGGAGLLELDEPFDRAWRRVGLALDRVGFTVEDRDRSKGYYFVRYVDPGQDAATKKREEGILSKLAFWRSDNTPLKSEQYRVLVKDGNDMSRVQVLNKDGAPERSDVSQKILALLHEQLK